VAEQIAALEPTGEDNRPPILMTRHLRVIDARQVGKEGSHLKLKLADYQCDIDAIGFKLGHWLNHLPNYIDVAYNLDKNEYRGEVSLQLRLVDIKASV
jgi:single-stranded-DNA-specific exonuclease